jgi:hypothetical protein
VKLRSGLWFGEDPPGVSVLEQVIWHLETWRPAKYLCIYAD